MKIQALQTFFSRHPSVAKLQSAILRTDTNVIQISGLQESAVPLVFSSLINSISSVCVFILDDEEQAGYFYHDLTQVLGDEYVLFFPSSYKRAIKYGQRDAGNEILRTEVLSRLSSQLSTQNSKLYIVAHPQALSELVVTQKCLNEQTLTVQVGEMVDIVFVQETLLSFGFKRVDYVYEPGQFVVRGSILDVYSYSCEFPYRIDFFGDEVDSIRTFEVQSQLSKTKFQQISIVPELSAQKEQKESFLSFLPKDSLLVMHDIAFVADSIQITWDEGFSKQAMTEGLEIREEELEKSSVLVNPEDFRKQLLDFRSAPLNSQLSTLSPLPGEGAGVRPSTLNSKLSFRTHPQPVFHKNFSLVFESFRKYLDDGYQLYILADSQKQWRVSSRNKRQESPLLLLIIPFMPVLSMMT